MAHLLSSRNNTDSGTRTRRHIIALIPGSRTSSCTIASGSAADFTLHGRVVNSGAYPIATFEATDAKELRREFERSIDEYLAWCEEDGVEPKRPFSGRLNVRLGSELHAAVAAAKGVSINSWIVQALRETAGAPSS